MIYLIFAEFGNSEDWESYEEKYDANKDKRNSSSILQAQWEPLLYRNHCMCPSVWRELIKLPLSHLSSPFSFCFLSLGHWAVLHPPLHLLFTTLTKGFSEGLDSGEKEQFELSACKIKTPLYCPPLYPPYSLRIVQGNKGNHLFLWWKPMVGKRFDLSVEDAICLEKAWGWGLIALATESGCQLASSDNCFPWQDPVGREKRSAVWRVNAGIHFHRSPVIIVSWARGYLLPICVRAKLWLTPIDQRDQGMQGERERERGL